MIPSIAFPASASAGRSPSLLQHLRNLFTVRIAQAFLLAPQTHFVTEVGEMTSRNQVLVESTVVHLLKLFTSGVQNDTAPLRRCITLLAGRNVAGFEAAGCRLRSTNLQSSSTFLMALLCTTRHRCRTTYGKRYENTFRRSQDGKKNSGQSLQQHVKYGLLTSGSFTKIGSKQIGIMPMPIKYIYWLI